MKNLLILLLVCISGGLIAQSTSLAGKIMDGETGEELIGANVTLYKGGVLSTGASTDFEGNYSIKVDPGNYDVEVSYIGYQPTRITNVVIQVLRANKLDVQLGGSGFSNSWTFSQSTNFIEVNYHQLAFSEEEELTREELFNEAGCWEN